MVIIIHSNHHGEHQGNPNGNHGYHYSNHGREGKRLRGEGGRDEGHDGE